MRKLLIVLFVSLFLLLPEVSFAQSPSAFPSKTPKGMQVRQEAKEQITERRQEKVQALSDLRQERIRAFFGRMMSRFEAAISRLERLIERIQSRMDKIKSEDSSQDLTDEQGQLDEAKDKLEDASGKMTTLKDGLEELLTSDGPKEVFKEVGQNVRDLKQDLIEVHTLLVKIIGDIKGLRVGQTKVTPTPTP